MPTVVRTYDASHCRDFNTDWSSDMTGSTLELNSNIPSRLLVSSGAISDQDDVTDYRFTFETNDDGAVIPGSEIGIEYSTNGGSTFSDFFVDADLANVGNGFNPYRAYVDEDEFIAITAATDNPASAADTTGFVLGTSPLRDGQVLETDERPTDSTGGSSNINFPVGQNGEFLACFTRGMKIETARGDVAIEDLEVGDMVRTLDRGFQPVRFIHSSKKLAQGSMRPILFEPGTVGNTARLVVSQMHRFHTKDLPLISADLQDCLIHAVDLVNGSTIRVMTDLEEVEYFHMMFDHHELVYCHGSVSESWQPHRRNLRRNQALYEELMEIFPEIADKGHANGGAPVREGIRAAIQRRIQ